MEINKKLKGIYFLWVNVYCEPLPRSWNDTFEHYLNFTRYDFSDNWFEKILVECNLSGKDEFDSQLVLIEQSYAEYLEQQNRKREKREIKKMNIHIAHCARIGILPF